MAAVAETTESVLRDMLQERTGVSMLDSGGIPTRGPDGEYLGSTQGYGRHWERNAGRDFAAERASTIEAWHRPDSKYPPELAVTHNLYPWLLERVEFNPELDESLRTFAEREGQTDNPWIDTMRDFATHLRETRDDPDNWPTGIYGDGDAFVVNTYNGEDLLSQVLQYLYWSDNDGEHVLLQVHNGCDVRGGYTAPKAFDLTDELAIMDNANAYIFCPDCGGARWRTDDGCNWYGEGYPHQTPDMKTYDTSEAAPEYRIIRDAPGQQHIIDMETERPHDTGVLWIDDDHNAHCPCCGAVLAASA